MRFGPAHLSRRPAPDPIELGKTTQLIKRINRDPLPTRPAARLQKGTCDDGKDLGIRRAG